MVTILKMGNLQTKYKCHFIRITTGLIISVTFYFIASVFIIENHLVPNQAPFSAPNLQVVS